MWLKPDCLESSPPEKPVQAETRSFWIRSGKTGAGTAVKSAPGSDQSKADTWPEPLGPHSSSQGAEVFLFYREKEPAHGPRRRMLKSQPTAASVVTYASIRPGILVASDVPIGIDFLPSTAAHEGINYSWYIT